MTDCAAEFAGAYLNKYTLRKISSFINDKMGLLLQMKNIRKTAKNLSNMFFSYYKPGISLHLI